MSRKLSLYIAFLLLLTIGIGVGMHAYFAQRAQRVVWKTVTVKDPPGLPVLPVDHVIRQPALTSSQVAVASPGGSLFAVLSKPDELTILDAQNGHVVSQTRSTGTIQNVTWVSDRLLFFLTSNNTLFTYDVLAQRVRLIQSFQVSSNESFRTIAFSSYTNDTFVIFSNQSGNTVYQFDTNEHDYLRNLGNLSILHAYYGTTNLTLYIEDTNHTLYELKNGYIRRLRQHAAILKGAGNELYYATLNEKGEAVSVEKYDNHGVSQAVCSLPAPTPIGDVVIDHAGHVFAVQGNTLFDAMHHRQFRVPAGFSIRVIGNQMILVKGADYKVLVN